MKSKWKGALIGGVIGLVLAFIKYLIPKGVVIVSNYLDSLSYFIFAPIAGILVGLLITNYVKKKSWYKVLIIFLTTSLLAGALQYIPFFLSGKFLLRFFKSIMGFIPFNFILLFVPFLIILVVSIFLKRKDIFLDIVTSWTLWLFVVEILYLTENIINFNNEAVPGLKIFIIGIFIIPIIHLLWRHKNEKK